MGTMEKRSDRLNGTKSSFEMLRKRCVLLEWERRLDNFWCELRFKASEVQIPKHYVC